MKPGLMVGPSCETSRLGDACRARDHSKTVKHLPPVYLEVHLEGPSVLAWCRSYDAMVAKRKISQWGRDKHTSLNVGLQVNAQARKR